jgi:hypothetical protein
MLVALHSEHPNVARGARSAVMVVGHPGHELRVYGWLTQTRPVVHVLTDGSGSDGQSRIASTSSLLEHAGARRGGIYGRMTDREVYASILAGDHGRFLALAEDLAASLVRENADLVAGDAVEGFNPSHDVCRYIINAGARIASQMSGRAIPCYAFPLESAPNACPDGLRGRALRLDLDDETLERKLQAAHAYAELKSEVERTLGQYGKEPFRTEYLWPVDLEDPYGWDPARIPFYESYGAERVASGAYTHVVKFREHVQPLADALFSHRATVA